MHFRRRFRRLPPDFETTEESFTQNFIKIHKILPLDVDSINENDSVANPDPTPRIASVHKSRFAEVVLVGCWIEAVYYGLLLFTMT